MRKITSDEVIFPADMKTPESNHLRPSYNNLQKSMRFTMKLKKLAPGQNGKTCNIEHRLPPQEKNLLRLCIYIIKVSGFKNVYTICCIVEFQETYKSNYK